MRHKSQNNKPKKRNKHNALKTERKHTLYSDEFQSRMACESFCAQKKENNRPIVGGMWRDFLLLLFVCVRVLFIFSKRSASRLRCFDLSIDFPLPGLDEMCWETPKIHFHRPTMAMNLWWYSLKLPQGPPKFICCQSFQAWRTVPIAKCAINLIRFHSRCNFKF